MKRLERIGSMEYPTPAVCNVRAVPAITAIKVPRMIKVSAITFLIFSVVVKGDGGDFAVVSGRMISIV